MIVQKLCHWGVGLVFVISSIAKTYSLNSFATEIAMFADAYLWERIIAFSVSIAFVLCIIEFVIGVASFFESCKLPMAITYFIN